ncbi:MAG TPA: uracil-DNA glycosylase family protein [Saprospiraceae bacterium]|nr:uracil-DNA glycosylase family protein [Saprospiraceae bacterium]
MFSTKVLSYHFALKPDISLPKDIEWLMPYDDPETRKCMSSFYQKFYNDDHQRTFILGINPGRFGAGLTGVPFTDPIRLNQLGIENMFPQKPELSSVFIYDMIDACGGPSSFYKKYYITSLSPLGFVKAGKNYNYYDDPKLSQIVRPFIISNIETQLKFGADTSKVFCLGQGKNYEYLSKLNDEYQWWERVIPLPHPRWVMQYRLKRKEEFVQMYREWLHAVENGSTD